MENPLREGSTTLEVMFRYRSQERGMGGGPKCSRRIARVPPYSKCSHEKGGISPSNEKISLRGGGKFP